MVRVLSVACALVLLFGLQAQEIRFSCKPMAEGTTRIETQDSHTVMNIVINIQGQVAYELEQKQSQTRKKEETVLKTTKDNVSKVQVLYAEAMNKQGNSITGEQLQIDVVKGKTYIVECKEGELLVTGPQGEKIDDNEFSLVKEDYQRLGKPEPVAQFFHGKTLAIGQKVMVPEEAAVELFRGQQENLRVEEFSFIFRETSKQGKMPCGVFDTVLKMAGDSDGIAIAVDLKGTTTVREDCRVISLDLKGMSTIHGEHESEDGKMEMAGKGEVVINLSNLYREK